MGWQFGWNTGEGQWYEGMARVEVADSRSLH